MSERWIGHHDLSRAGFVEKQGKLAEDSQDGRQDSGSSSVAGPSRLDRASEIKFSRRAVSTKPTTS